MQGLLRFILNAMQDAQTFEGTYNNIGNLLYTIKYTKGEYELFNESHEKLVGADMQLYTSTIAKIFLIVIKEI